MKKVLLMSLLCLWGVGMQGADTSILDFGAHQNSADNTKAIQAAIDSTYTVRYLFNIDNFFEK